MNRKVFGLCFLCVALVMASACGGAGRYQLRPKPESQDTIPMRVVVSDFVDEREFVRISPTRSNVRPLSWYKKFEYSRYEDQFPGGMEPFPTRLAKILAEDVGKTSMFDSIRYVSPAELAAMRPGDDYDLRVDGKMNTLTAKGYWRYYSLILPFGLYANDLLWVMGFPKEVRRWDVDVDLQLVDAYRNEPVGRPANVAFVTNGQVFTIYHTGPSALRDFRAKMPEVSNKFNEQMAGQFSQKTDADWAALRQSGREFQLAQERRQQMIERGAPPSFTFISPGDGSSVREQTTTIRWAATVANGLKTISLTLNGEPLNTGIDAAALTSVTTAPDSISARDLPVQLALGDNRIEASLTDHLDNSTRASITVKRLPRVLRPERRFALLVGAGSTEAVSTVGPMEVTLRDPIHGQFTDVIRVASTAVSRADLDDAVARFGSRALAGDLAMIYVAATGDAGNITIGTGNTAVPLADFVEMLRNSLGTEEVLLILDLDLSTGSGGSITGALQAVPARWAVVLNNSTPTAAHKTAGEFTLGRVLGETFRQQPAGRESLSLEAFLDSVGNAARSTSGGMVSPDVRGRYDANITMVEFR